MTTKPSLLMLVNRPADWRLDLLAADYHVHHQSGAGIEALVTGGRQVIDKALIDSLPDLEIIAVCAVGYDQVDISYALSRGIAVTNTPDVLTDDVADLALALMLSVSRRVAVNDRYVRDGSWETNGAPALARKFSGQRIGILGLGRIGRAIAQRAQAFGCEVRYFSRHAKGELPWRHEPDMHALAAWADMLVVAVSGGLETAGLVDANLIEALGPAGTLINVSRGSVVDEPALVDALLNGRLGGAGLDVFADEPHVADVLRTLDNVVLQPHQGSATRETRAAMGELVKANLAAHFGGRPLLTPVSGSAATAAISADRK